MDGAELKSKLDRLDAIETELLQLSSEFKDNPHARTRLNVAAENVSKAYENISFGVSKP